MHALNSIIWIVHSHVVIRWWMRRKTPTILSNEWPDVASYLTETSGIFTRKSLGNRRSLEALKQF